MRKLKAILFSTLLVVLGLGMNAMASSAKGSSAVTFQENAVTTNQSAVFGTLVAVLSESNFDTALSVSNVVATPGGMLDGIFGRPTNDDMGTIQFYLFDQSTGQMSSYETQVGSPGHGLNADGTLGPGATYTVLLSELLNAMGAGPDFVGYMWVVGNFDAIQGTYSLTSFDVGFTQNYAFEPTMGSGGFFGGIPMPINP